MKNYVPYHVHTMLSNCTTNVDSVTKLGQYVARAQELGMKAFGFSEHGNIFEWLHKKEAVEKAGMKYMHGVEAYITMTSDEKVRDNYHTILYARNYDGFLELNRLVSGSFERKTSNHFYYTPRIFMDELEQTSGNILSALCRRTKVAAGLKYSTTVSPSRPPTTRSCGITPDASASRLLPALTATLSTGHTPKAASNCSRARESTLQAKTNGISAL